MDLTRQRSAGAHLARRRGEMPNTVCQLRYRRRIYRQDSQRSRVSKVCVYS